MLFNINWNTTHVVKYDNHDVVQPVSTNVIKSTCAARLILMFFLRY